MQIVLVEPEIPQNTGTIARTCAATETNLHLVEPLGFEITEKAVRRAGLDYWPYVNLTQHSSWEECQEQLNGKRMWFFSTKAERYYWDVEYAEGDVLVFGPETRGLGQDFLGKQPEESLVRIPMSCSNVRSLNLSNAVSIALYESLRQCQTLK